MNLQLFISKLSLTPWVVHPNLLTVVEQVLNNKFNGVAIKTSESVKDNELKVEYEVIDGKAVIPIHGLILKNTVAMEGISGLETVLNIKNSVSAALADDRVKEIILDIDSPGGTVDGIAELSEFIRESSTNIKPIDSYANGMCCSGAYWLASATRKVYGYLNTAIGSIGVYLMHIDQSEYNKEQGVKVTYIKAGEYKTIGNPHESLDKKSLGVLQHRVDLHYSIFLEHVAKYRDMSMEEVEKVAEGKVYVGKEALDNGLIDEIRNFDGIIDSSNTYNFLKEGHMSLFGKKEVEANVENLKEHYPELVKEIVDEESAKSSAELDKVKAERDAAVSELNGIKNRAERSEKIMNLANILNLSEKGEELVKSDCSIEEACVELTKEANNVTLNLKENFNSTAADVAGKAKGDKELSLKEPNNQETAYAYCKDKYGVTGKEAWVKAKTDFPSLFGISENVGSAVRDDNK